MVTKYTTGDQCICVNFPVTIVSAEQHGDSIVYNVKAHGTKKEVDLLIPESMLQGPIPVNEINER